MNVRIIPLLGAAFLFWGFPRIKKRQDRGGERQRRGGSDLDISNIQLTSLLYLGAKNDSRKEGIDQISISLISNSR